MGADVAVRQEAGPRGNLADLDAASHHGLNAGPNAVPIARSANEGDLKPVIAVAAVVAQQGGRIVDIEDEDVDVAVVVVVAKGRPRLTFSTARPLPALGADLDKGAAAVIVKEEIALGVPRTHIVVVQNRIDVAVGGE